MMAEIKKVEAKKQETTLKCLIRGELDQGKAESLDPDNAGLKDLALRRTTIYSPWYTRLCPGCKHKFREEDKVRLCPQCGHAWHDDSQYSLYIRAG